MMHFKFYTSYVHAYIFSFLFYSCFLVVMLFSLSRINYAWHPKRVNPLQARIHFKVSVLLLLIPFPLLTFGTMMRRPERTSWRPFKNVVFIQSVMLFCRTYLTLLSPLLFELWVGNLCLRVP